MRNDRTVYLHTTYNISIMICYLYSIYNDFHTINKSNNSLAGDIETNKSCGNVYGAHILSETFVQMH